MNKRVKKLWLATLRGGKYKQGKSAMRSGKDRFCCLGVLCDLYVKNHRIKWELRGGDYAIYGQGYFLPAEVMKWAKIETDNVEIKQIRTDLSTLNDNGKSFKYIADQIEKYL